MDKKQLADQNISLIIRVNLLISQLADIGCPDKILDQLSDWNLDRAIHLEKINRWKAWATK